MAGTQNQPLEYEQVSYNAPGGIQICSVSTASAKFGFFGKAPIGIQTLTCAISTTASRSTSGCYGFDTSTETLQIANAVSSIGVILRAIGLVV